MEIRLYNLPSGLFFRSPNCLKSDSEKARRFASAKEAFDIKRKRTFPLEWIIVYLDENGEWRRADKSLIETLI